MSTRKQIVFRIEETHENNSSAFKRCLILANAHIERGGSAHFITNSIGKNTRETLTSNHLSYNEVSTIAGTEEDQILLIAIATRLQAFAIVIDGQGFQGGYLQKTASAFYTVVIDDHGQRALPVQLIVNGRFSADEHFYICRPDSTLFLGPAYTLLSTDISDFPRPALPCNTSPVQRVLVACNDEHDTARVIHAMQAPQQTTILSVVGNQCPLLDTAIRVACARGYTIEHLGVHDLPNSLLFCDAALTSPNGAVSALGYYGIPTQLIASNDTLSREVHRLAEEEACLHIPPLSEIGDIELGQSISDFISDRSRLQRFGKRLATLVDGQAADRILDCVAKSNQPKLRLLSAA